MSSLGSLPTAPTRPIDVRSLTIIRESLGYHHILADSVFAMQGIGTGAIWMHGSDTLRSAISIPVVAVTKSRHSHFRNPKRGSDVASMTTSARKEGEFYVLNGTKTWITNAGLLTTILSWLAPARRRVHVASPPL
jgi:acyl-CoA dehydrogenase